MSITSETTLFPAISGPADTIGSEHFSDRRADIDYKVTLLADLLESVDCEGALFFLPENFAWLTSGATARGILNPEEMPAVYCNGDQKWLLCSNVDSQRLFDEELDELGFQLKEWPWHWSREEMLTILCQNRKVACDIPFQQCKIIGEEMRTFRRSLTLYEQACLQTVGGLVSHAVEATCRTMPKEVNERDIAAQVAHRMIHRGVQMVQISVAVDGRSRLYRHHGYTSMPLENYAVICATGRKYGVCTTTARVVSFGPPDEHLRKEHDAACKVSATYLASSWPDAVPRDILTTARRVYEITGYEHDWRMAPQGHITGRAPVEERLLPSTAELFRAQWAITWQASVGASNVCDTILITDQGPKVVTPTEVWPLKRIRVQGADFVRPDILLREE